MNLFKGSCFILRAPLETVDTTAKIGSFEGFRALVWVEEAETEWVAEKGKDN